LRYSKEEKEKAFFRLHDLLKPGDLVYTELLQVSRSGMTRHIKPLVIRENAPVWIGYHVAVLGGDRVDNQGGVIVSGCGMDMGFSLIYNLSWRLWPNGFGCLGEGVDHASRCPASDHSNGAPYVKQYGPEDCPGRPCSPLCDHRGVPDVIHQDGGYALRHRWI